MQTLKKKSERFVGLCLAVAALLSLSACAITVVTSQNSSITRDARKVAEMDVLYLDRSSVRVGIQKYRSIYSAYTPDNGHLAARVGDIVAAFGGELTGGFEAAAGKRGVLRSVSGAKATHATQAELVASLAAMRFARDEVLVISPASASVTCGDNRCSFEIFYESVLYDAKARKPMWFAKQNVTVVRTLSDRGAAKLEFDPPEAVDSYWNAVFDSLRSGKLID
jgi:hypothetical protein